VEGNVEPQPIEASKIKAVKGWQLLRTRPIKLVISLKSLEDSIADSALKARLLGVQTLRLAKPA
jgi:hypothetical protein